MLGSLQLNIFRKVLKNGRNSPHQSKRPVYRGWSKENGIIRSCKRILWWSEEVTKRQTTLNVFKFQLFWTPWPCILMSSQILSLTKEVRVLVWFLWFEGSKQGLLRCLAVVRRTNIRLGTAWTGTEEKTEVATLKHSSGWGCLDHCVQLWSIRLTEERRYDERPASFPAPEMTKQPRLLQPEQRWLKWGIRIEEENHGCSQESE